MFKVNNKDTKTTPVAEKKIHWKTPSMELFVESSGYNSTEKITSFTA